MGSACGRQELFDGMVVGIEDAGEVDSEETDGGAVDRMSLEEEREKMD